ncbi:spore germination protein [Ectobacillus panaciterrae]
MEEFIADKAITIFPTTYNTERPNTVAGHLLEGKAVVQVQ